MDANGQKFWLFAEARDWAIPTGEPVHYNSARRALCLSSARNATIEEQPERAEALLATVPQAVDQLGTYAYFERTPEGVQHVVAAGAGPEPQPILSLDASETLSDLAVGFDGVLYAARSGSVFVRDLRARWPEFTLAHAELDAFRLAAQPGGGVLVLDRAARRIWRVRGLPFPALGTREFAPDVFRPRPENPDPPVLEPFASFAPVLDPVAIATSDAGETLLLAWGAGADEAFVQRLIAPGRLSAPQRLVGVGRPFSLCFLSDTTFAVLIAKTTGAEVIPYAWSETETELEPLGGVYPLADYVEGPFAQGARYPNRPAAAKSFAHPRALVRLSAPELARSAHVRNRKRIDSHRYDTVWHRVYMEAQLPEQCGVRLWLAASDAPEAPDDLEFSLHLFGDLAADSGIPRAVWSSYPSELPHHPGLLAEPPEPQRAGLFSVLIQRTGRKVSALAGRYLWFRLELVGNGRASPEIAALRAYGSRFSYVSQYLPRFYHEQLYAPDSEQASAQTTPADFLERMLLNFEGVLTPLEDRIAHAHLLTHPSTIPADALDWLGQWLGFTFDPAYPREYQRRALASAAELQRTRGTLRGLKLALDIVTGDAVSRGEILVIEDFRLRRTFATILGADLADEDDPLLAGLVRSGNSFVGDSLILSREFQHEFVAVFRATLPEPPQGGSLDEWVNYVFQRLVSSPAVDAFFDEQANRATVLVRQETSAERVQLIERVLELEAPAHVQTQVVRATQPFIVGLASLVGVDTFLRDPVPAPVVRADETALGGQAFLHRHASLDPRLEGGSP